jgi:hypothetical protein
MDPLLTIFSVLLFIAALCLIFYRNSARKYESDNLIKTAKTRIKKRQLAEQEHTQYEDAYHASIDISASASATEVYDLYEGAGPLTKEQTEIIDRLVSEYSKRSR